MNAFGEIGPTSNPAQAGSKRRIAFIVSHPVQYYAPLHQRLARRDDLVVKVFFTWHAGNDAVHDHGFKMRLAWDVPLTQGYDFEVAPNLSSDPGTHHFSGLQNPSLVPRVLDWRPDVVHITGWAWQSHFVALRAFQGKGIPTLFRGDSHLLDESRRGLRWYLKRAILRRVFSWPAGFLAVGSANRAYYEAFGVDDARIYDCPHSIDVARFAEPSAQYEAEAARWRAELGIEESACVLLFAGKFERKKQPLELMRAVQSIADRPLVLVMVGAGEFEADVKRSAAGSRELIRVLAFQNQSRMPVVYRLADLFVLPSAFGESWGIGVNEALACGRPVLVSDRVGCAADLVDSSCGRVFASGHAASLETALAEMTGDVNVLRALRAPAAQRARAFDIPATEAALMAALDKFR